MIRLGILGSTRGTNLGTLITAIANAELKAEIAVVMSNKKEAFIVERAMNAGIATEFHDPHSYSREAYDMMLAKRFQYYRVDLVVLIGYMRILSKVFIDAFPKRIINIHPSLLPAFSGLMNLTVHESVLAAKHLETGCTVHEVTEELDAGPILLQKKCWVDPNDTAHTLQKRVQALEGLALIECIQQLSERSVETFA